MTVFVAKERLGKECSDLRDDMGQWRRTDENLNTCVLLLRDLRLNGGGLSGPLFALEDGPVELIIANKAAPFKQISEQHSQGVVIGLIGKAVCLHDVQVLRKFDGVSLSQDLWWRLAFLLANGFVLQLLVGDVETRPRKRSSEEVQEDVAQALEVVTATLLAATMGVDAGIAGGSRKTLSLAVGNVAHGLGVKVLLGQTEINDVDNLGLRLQSNEEVIGFDVTVDEALLMDEFDALEKLVCDHQDSLNRELSTTKLEKIFETRTKKIHNKNVIVSLDTPVPDGRDSDPTIKQLVDF